MIDPRARIAPGVVIDGEVTIYRDVEVGEGSMLQHGTYLPPGVTLGRRVFVGPNATFTNDRHPKANSDSWVLARTVVEDDASIGANATIVAGVRIGAGALVAAGAVVWTNVDPGVTVAGNPARPWTFARSRDA